MLRFVPVVAVLALALAACGGSGDDDDPTPSVSPPAGSTPSGDVREVTDEEYLAVICTGLDEFWDALNTATSTEAIGATVEDFIASLEEVTPPSDVQPFHGDLLAYLRDALDEPTELATAARPLPEDDVRERLAAKESDVPECSDMTFFSPRSEDAGG